MAMMQPPDDQQFATKRDLQDGLAQLRTDLVRFITERFATKRDLQELRTDLVDFMQERFATKRDLQELRTELIDFIKEHCASKADLERVGRVYAWGVVGAMGVMLAATLAGMWGVVHTLVSLAD